MFKEFLKKLIANKMAFTGTLIVIFVLIVGICAPLLITHDPMHQSLRNIGESPNAEYLFGTDNLGRDIYSRVIAGARTSLLIGVFVTALSTFFGTLIGTTCGYFGGKIDALIMKVMDVVMAFPSILLALVFVTIFGRGLYSAMTGVGISIVPRFARLVRGSVLSIKEKEYIEAERAVGQRDLIIMFRHVLPNCIGPIIVQATLAVGNAIITVAGLGFLGLGAEPGVAEWGAMLSDARNFLGSMPQIATYPGLAIAITVLGFNLMGDGFRDILDVRQDDM